MSEARDRVAEQTAIRHALLKNGYVPLANKSKLCILKNWPRLDVDEAMIEDWADRRLLATGVRIEGGLVALDFDVDDSAALDAIWDALPDDLYALVEQMPERRGKGEKVCLFCRLADGLERASTIWSKAFYAPGHETDEDATTHRLEVFAGGSSGRQVGVYGAHTVEGGEVLVEYQWADGRGLVEVPFEALPTVTVAQLESLADVVSRVLHDRGWVYEVSSLSGRVAEDRAYEIDDGCVFSVYGGGARGVSLDDLIVLAETMDGVRVSMGWRETGAVNRTRGLVSINPGDGQVQIWDTMTGILYRPRTADVRETVRGLGERLQRRVGVSGETAESGSENAGSGSRLEALLAAVPEESRLFASGAVEDGGGGGSGVEGDGRPVLDLSGGRLTLATLEAATVLAETEHLFDMSGRLVGVVDGAIREMTEPRLSLEIGAMFQCVRVEGQGKRRQVQDVDPSGGLVRQVLSYMPEAGFRPLRGVVDMPVLSGGQVVSDGYDAASQLLVSDSSGAAQWLVGSAAGAGARTALDALWRPFREFPFVGAGDRGGALACVLTAVARAWLPTAPMFAFDAPVQGSGKSLLCRAIGALSGRCLFSAPLPLKNEDEIRKRIMSTLLAGPSSVIYDNQIGMLDSASLAAVLTSEVFSDRELGHNTRTLQAPTSVLVMVNGNNLLLGGDMPRRTVRVRIDPQMDTPFERQFDFDPATWVRENRGEMVAAALTLLCWGMSWAGKGRVGSFERWDEVVGQTVARIGAELDGAFGDPADVIRSAHEDDPRRDELGDLLGALRDEFGNKWFMASEVVSRMAGGGGGNPLVEAFGYDKPPSARSVGRHLTFRRDAWVNGLCVQVGTDARTNTRRFRVWATDDEDSVVVQGALEIRRAAQRTKLGSVGKGRP